MSNKTLSINVYYGDQLVETKTLSQDVIKIGKLKSSHLCLDDDSVARMHAVIEVSGEDVRVIDLGSGTGTGLNGQRIDKNAILSDGDVLQFGPYRLEVGFVAPQPVAAAPAPVPMAAAAAPVAAAAVAHAPARAAIQIDASEYEVQDGTRVAEVVAMYGSTVLDVQHVGQVKSKRATAPLWAVLGGVLVIGGVALFGYEATRPWGEYKDQVIKAKEDGSVMPQRPGTGLGSVGIALTLLGLVPFTAGMIRLNDVVSRNYSIGEGHTASFHVPPDGLPDSAAFPLVRGDGDFSLNFTQGMSGEVSFEGQTISLEQLVSSGRAGAGGASYSFPLPPGANCRVQYRDLTFYVNSVPPGAVIAGSSETDKPFWLYNGGSMAVIGSLILLSQLVEPPGNGLAFDEMDEDNRFVGYLNQPDKPP
ncbi:MAG: FHA domain-containing protein, partial [Nannocystaceae bacterium]